MKDYEALIKECLDEVKAVNITPGHIVKWSINTRARSRWGLCTMHRDGTCEIEIAARLLMDDRVSVKQCKDTIIHEILHSCKGCQGHTGRWKKYAELMNATYGYNIKRVTGSEEKGLEKYEVKSRAPRYAFRCKVCGQLIIKKQRCKFTKHYRMYGCGICGTRNAFVQVVQSDLR